ncbi:meiotic recombination protein SPO11-2 [Planoprotostelium fungivorum]|uniref:Meiotic recombination protein SPO11-2 n=1 Tax=Planoprotostelium fungivorum TaxID=1890364 RepID=A0A2P6NLN4_9EUKA|nr:meiotic recombination protein SPO11-2 [Planoprotostelium fungivorum]
MTNHFSSQMIANSHILDLASILSCSRSCLNIIASPKGMVAGCMEGLRLRWDDSTIRDSDGGGQIVTGIPIANDLEWIDECTTDARYILIVEKESVFDRLCEDRIWASIPLIVICGRGFPDMATRKLVVRLSHKFHLTLLGLFDYNVGGYLVLQAYTNRSMNVLWLGLHRKHLELLKVEPYCVDITAAMTPIKPKAMNTLKRCIAFEEEEHKRELERMMALSMSVELQVLNSSHRHGHELLTPFVARLINMRQWI